MELKLPQEYIEIEKHQLEDLKERLKKLESKWFKNSGMNEEIEFLKKYIKLKSKFVLNLRS